MHELTFERAPAVRGVCPVLETPFTDDGRVDEAAFACLIDHVLATGVRSVMFPGFASEFHKLTADERKGLTQLLLERTRDRPDCVAVISVPDHATRMAVEQARWAVQEGADALNVLPPHFLGPPAPAIRAHVMHVLDAVAPVPVILQYAPSQTGTVLDTASIARVAVRAPNLVQLKVEAIPAGPLISALLQQAPTLSSVVGHAGVQLPDALRRGAVGVQPGCSFVELYVQFWQLWHSGDEQAAYELHRRMLPYLSYWMQGVELIIAAEKAVSIRRGLIPSAHCRAPGRLLDTEELAMVDRFLAEFADLLPVVT